METTANNAANVVRQQTGEVIPFRLAYPIKLKDGTTLEVLNLRRPVGREMRNIEVTGRKPFDLTLQVVQATCGLTHDEADLLDGGDVNEIMEVVLPFLETGRGGKQSS
ncbi:tail assembly chaperone E/41/14-like protein [Paucimonas lemoignei]|uniref:Tail assembly chaperone E/41/14-like protein n=1 Tax=Paucimonas lemoignei TaxID=29443 RepID=A0A4R3HW38_PAULE|nr:phage tail assembly protein [Paucimonas lemoignei]TCS37487.1 tail assembly chaperone E/41/14-like protein [Paucimonas lemoignei]